MEPMTYKERIKAIDEFRETVISDIESLIAGVHEELSNSTDAEDWTIGQANIDAYKVVIKILKTY